ncbi:MAG: nitroreductase [Sphingobium sp.]
MSISVSEAVALRRSVRRFLPDPVPLPTIRRVLEQAMRAPSGGNVQPWNGIVLTGEPLNAVIAAVLKQVALSPDAAKPEFPVYPPGMGSPWRDRQITLGKALYTALHIERHDMEGRHRQHIENFRAFGAPVCMFVTIDRTLGPPQWGDVGMWLQTIMLLLREQGIDSCAQEAWSAYGRTVRDCLGVGDEKLLYCGLAIGYRDGGAEVNNFPVPRAPLDEIVTFRGFE